MVNLVFRENNLDKIIYVAHSLFKVQNFKMIVSCSNIKISTQTSSNVFSSKYSQIHN